MANVNRMFNWTHFIFLCLHLSFSFSPGSHGQQLPRQTVCAVGWLGRWHQGWLNCCSRFVVSGKPCVYTSLVCVWEGMHVHKQAYMHMLVSGHIHACVEVMVHIWCLLVSMSAMFFEAGSLTECELTSSSTLAGYQGPSVLLFLSLPFYDYNYMLSHTGIFIIAGDLSSGLHDCVLGILITEVSPHTSIYLSLSNHK